MSCIVPFITAARDQAWTRVDGSSRVGPSPSLTLDRDAVLTPSRRAPRTGTGRPPRGACAPRRDTTTAEREGKKRERVSLSSVCAGASQTPTAAKSNQTGGTKHEPHALSGRGRLRAWGGRRLTPAAAGPAHELPLVGVPHELLPAAIVLVSRHADSCPPWIGALVQARGRGTGITLLRRSSLSALRG